MVLSEVLAQPRLISETGSTCRSEVAGSSADDYFRITANVWMRALASAKLGDLMIA